MLERARIKSTILVDDPSPDLQLSLDVVDVIDIYAYEKRPTNVCKYWYYICTSAKQGRFVAALWRCLRQGRLAQLAPGGVRALRLKSVGLSHARIHVGKSGNLVLSCVFVWRAQ